MKRRVSKKRIGIKYRRLKVGGVGLVGSPAFKSLRGLIPILVMVIVVSLGLLPINDEVRSGQHNVGRFPYSTLAHWNLAHETAKRFDYMVAESEYRLGEKYMDEDSPVLGVMSKIEEVVWPEVKIMEEINKKLTRDDVFRSRTLLLDLAVNYWSLGENERAREMLARAEEIDPNDVSIGKVRQLLDTER